MSLKDQLPGDASVFLNTDDFAESITMYDTSIGADEGTPFDGVLDIESSPLFRTSEDEAIHEQATLDMPAGITVNQNCWFKVNDERWNFVEGIERDAVTQTIRVQSDKPIAKRTARRR